jgi:predicted RND superfamily exporter protein
VLLTSVTTVAGLTPLLLESSFQAQVLIPMAASLSFGLMASTAVVLLLVPVLYSVYDRATSFLFESPDELEYDKRAHVHSAAVAKVVEPGEQGAELIQPELVPASIGTSQDEQGN